MGKKISQLTAISGSTFADADIFEISVSSGGAFVSRKITGAQIKATIPSGITINSTPITSGTSGRVLFENTGVVKESGNFYWDDTNARLSIGQGSSPGAVVDVKAAGATSTDLALRVRNSVNTKDLLLIRGNGDHELGATGSPSLSLIASSGYSYPSLYFKGQGGTERTQIYMTSNTFSFICTTSDTLTLSLNTTAMTFREGLNQVFGTTTGTKLGTSTSQKIGFWNATPIVQPTTAIASATVASPGGGINIKTDDTFDGYTIAQVVKALRNIGILA